MKPTFAVIGAGGVGGYFAGALLRAGYSVGIIARGAHLRAILERGLRVTTPDADFTVVPTIASDKAEAVGKVDAVIVGVKARQVENAVRSLSPLLTTTTKVLTLQNGIEAHEQVATILGRQHALIGVCRISASIVAPGHIQHHGLEPYIALGEADGSKLSPASLTIAAALRTAGVTIEIPEDIQSALWEKLLFIATVGGLGAVTRSPAGEFRSIPATRELLLRLLGEVVEVGRSTGVHISADAIARTMSYIDGLAPKLTTSMHRDIVAGVPSELDAIVGPIARLAEQHKITAPYFTFLFGSLWPQELRARSAVLPKQPEKEQN
jgi:2-dehydropantoate 2-reductase